MRIFGLTTIAFAGVMASSAMAADMPLKAPQMAPAPQFTWTGWYVGVEGGWGESSFNSTRNVANTNFVTGTTFTGKGSGFLGGLQIGADYQFNWLVVGIMGDFQGSTLKSSTALGANTGTGNTVFVNRDTDWVGTIAGRLGLGYDRWLVYGKGGAAWKQSNDDATNTVYSPAGVYIAQQKVGSSTDFGYVVGGGVEYALADNISVQAEYDYYNFGNVAGAAATCTFGGACISAPAGDVSVSSSMWEVKGAINLRFNPFPAAAPVMARY